METFISKIIQRTTKGQWLLTPVELFRPYYSYILTNWIVVTSQQQQQQDLLYNKNNNNKQEIEIIEIGGGREVHQCQIYIE
mmetsp:Transcript_47105/g.71245  ORF Transcript_47105/g.71245 Transcript_47105/m.71245 type:complete len:81 (-) Transcript_47105:163-405(-)